MGDIGKRAQTSKDVTPEHKEFRICKASPMSLQKNPSNLIVTDTGKKMHCHKQSANGSQVDILTETKKRRMSCKQTGAHVATESITKKQKVIETKTKIVETQTITVKRVRNK